MEAFTAIVTPPGGRDPVHLTPEVDTVSFSTVALGGFGSCSFTVPLAQVKGGIRRLPKLSDVVLLHGSRVLWEGRVEDHNQDFISGTLGLSCFGHQRILDETSVKRIWIQRSIPWQLVNNLAGRTGLTFASDLWAWSTVGRFDDTDLARSGIRFSTVNSVLGRSAVVGEAHGAWYWTDATMLRLLFRYIRTFSDPGDVTVWDSTNGTSWTSRFSATADFGFQDANVTLGGSVQWLCVTVDPTINLSGANLSIDLDRMRILGAVTTEDASGGFYAHTLLSDLLDQVPGLKKGVIEQDTTFLLESLSRAQRDRALSVVQEIASYFQRRWAVWEDRTFSWKSVNLEEPQWVLQLRDLDQCRITSSGDNVAKTMYLSYTDVGTGFAREVSAVATDQRNPYVKAGTTKDEILAAPVGMTSASATQLVNRLGSDHGALPAIRGSVRLGAWVACENLVGQRMPACYIRAGENIVIPELPKDHDIMRPGRDGETLFHVTASTTDMEEGWTTLELEGYSRSTDILMARLSAATRTLTG